MLRLWQNTFDNCCNKQGSNGHGKSWKILKFETIIPQSWKSHGFLSFFKKSWKTDISRKSHGILHKPSVMCTMYGYGSLVVCIIIQVHYFRSRSLVNVYINVCLVMVVAVRAGHLDFSKKFKFMVIDFNFIQSIQLYRPNL